jgi:hypothetical protein
MLFPTMELRARRFERDRGRAVEARPAITGGSRSSIVDHPFEIVTRTTLHAHRWASAPMKARGRGDRKIFAPAT